MKRRLLFGLLVSVIILKGIVYLPVLAQLPANSRLNQAQIQQLRSLGIKIVVPTDVSAGFRVASVRVEAPCRPRSQCAQYAIIYRNSSNACFAIEGIYGGIGGIPERENQITVDTQLFGQTTLYYGHYQDPEMRQNFPEADMYMDWAGNGPFYRFIGAGFVRQSYYGERNSQPIKECRNDISTREAVKVIRSLSML